MRHGRNRRDGSLQVTSLFNPSPLDPYVLFLLALVLLALYSSGCVTR